MTTKIQQWGNSLALRIPKAFAVEANLHKGAVVDVSEEGGKIILTPVKKRKFTLESLLAGVTKENIHSEISTGKRVGKEIW
ncbi:MAG: AbrB/MazE/SpoVT family DNA-binding domain-containing protein [Thermodesulfovibrionales bacterium]|jgi:antitoxin MazE|nr:AbrB/MazE/SpoVT family DNA-binding domain-containing protein [Thermodesulfovibrionales bacterium]